MISCNKYLKALKFAVLMMAAVILAAGLSVRDVCADSDEPGIPEEVRCYYYPDQKSIVDTDNGAFLFFGDEYEVNLKKSRSSNPKVAVIRKDKYLGNCFAVIKKAGKTTLKIYAKSTEGGDYQTYKIRVIAGKYIDPAAKFKVGKNDFTSQFKKTSIGESAARIKGKISITPKKGWKLKSVYAKHYEGKIRKLKNNRSVSINDEWTLMAKFKNKKSGKIIVLSLAQLVGGGD